MRLPELDRRRGGVALLVGYLLLLAVSFGGPARGLAGLDTTGSVLVFLVLPVLGSASGVFAVARVRFAGVGLFLMGSYLAVVGLTLGFGLVPVSAAVTVVGLAIFVLAFVSVLASLFALWASLS